MTSSLADFESIKSNFKSTPPDEIVSLFDIQLAFSPCVDGNIRKHYMRQGQVQSTIEVGLTTILNDPAVNTVPFHKEYYMSEITEEGSFHIYLSLLFDEKTRNYTRQGWSYLSAKFQEILARIQLIAPSEVLLNTNATLADIGLDAFAR